MAVACATLLSAIYSPAQGAIYETYTWIGEGTNKGDLFDAPNWSTGQGFESDGKSMGNIVVGIPNGKTQIFEWESTNLSAYGGRTIQITGGHSMRVSDYCHLNVSDSYLIVRGDLSLGKGSKMSVEAYGFNFAGASKLHLDGVMDITLVSRYGNSTVDFSLSATETYFGLGGQINLFNNHLVNSGSSGWSSNLGTIRGVLDVNFSLPASSFEIVTRTLVSGALYDKSIAYMPGEFLSVDGTTLTYVAPNGLIADKDHLGNYSLYREGNDLKVTYVTSKNVPEPSTACLSLIALSLLLLRRRRRA